MTRLVNDPADFAAEMIEGFVAAHADRVRAVPGGVVRARPAAAGTVAVVIGGGSGHYPAFGGLVGPGLAHGAVMGNVFASPSTQQIINVARAAERGAGVLLGYGNYAGDVLNFEAAAERLRADGIACQTIAVTDDVASAPLATASLRRGIAGDLVVFKIAAAAAEAGVPLAEVARLADLANARTCSFGVAFAGCTLPGAAAPLFTVPTGRMAVGLGIHGEPGIGETDVPTADELAGLLVGRLVAERPAGPPGERAVVLLNGLGTVKHEELFVLYGSVARRLAAAGVQVVEPEVGELCTSFDLAGVSLTLGWLTPELESLWSAPCAAPGFRKGSVDAVDDPSAAEIDAAIEHVPTSVEAAVEPGSPASQRAAGLVVAALRAARDVVDDHVDELGRIDAVAGDGDHGIGMQRGASAATTAAERAADLGAGAGTVLMMAGDAWADRAGGTSGALWGAALRAMGASLGDHDRPHRAAVATAVDAGRSAIVAMGGAEVGDKTMVDALVPFAETLIATTTGATEAAWASAADASTRAAAATADLLPRKGRARPHAARSLGTPDAGAHSFALVVTAVGTVLTADRATAAAGA